MSRCSICDYSQSAPSFYNEGLQFSQSNNRVVHTRDHGDICTSCLDSINSVHLSYSEPNDEGSSGAGVFDIVDIEYTDDFQDDLFPIEVPADDVHQ
jgi:hypothetical protein